VSAASDAAPSAETVCTVVQRTKSSVDSPDQARAAPAVGKDVIGAGQVVAERAGAGGADEDRARVADAA
jgi:hypothetical protein